MALPRQLKNGLSPREIEFLAENEMIEIAPAIDTRQDLELLAGTVPSLKPLQLSSVPLWLAITLKKKQKCSIVVPKWMTIESLQAFLKQEEDEPRFSELPYHFIETAQLLLENACDDIPSADAVRTLIKNLREARQSKARLGVAQLGQDYLQMDNIGLMEINEIRPFFTKAFYEIHTLDQTRETMDPDRPLDLGYRGYDDDTYGSSMPETTRFNNSQSSRMSTS
ncbi:DNA replication protein psf2 [Podila horticola]|nr:DNA replication protein psf2 [Podila horticola]